MNTRGTTPSRPIPTQTHPLTPKPGLDRPVAFIGGGDEGHHVPSGNRGGHSGSRGAKPQWGGAPQWSRSGPLKSKRDAQSEAEMPCATAIGRPAIPDQSPETGEGPPTLSGGLPETLRATKRASCQCRPGGVPGVNGSKGTDLAWVLGASRELPFSESLPTPLGDVVPWVIFTPALDDSTGSGALIRRKCPPAWTALASAESPRPHRVADAHTLTDPSDDRVGRLPEPQPDPSG